MKHLIVGNWKMNPGSQKEAKELFNAVKKGVKTASAKVVVCPPAVYLPLFEGVSLGVQNVSFEEKGAFTGEVSVNMVKDLGVEYVLVGHSERRKYYGETDQIVNKKLKKVLEANLTPIFCIGEADGEDISMVLEKQLVDGLKDISREKAKHIVVAYEPVWAIGTGKNCSPDLTMKALLLIRKIVSTIYNREVADLVKILYGGSVNAKNSASYITEAGVNGLLVGGASLNPEEFTSIIESVS